MACIKEVDGSLRLTRGRFVFSPKRSQQERKTRESVVPIRSTNVRGKTESFMDDLWVSALFVFATEWWKQERIVFYLPETCGRHLARLTTWTTTRWAVTDQIQQLIHFAKFSRSTSKIRPGVTPVSQKRFAFRRCKTHCQPSYNVIQTVD